MCTHFGPIELTSAEVGPMTKRDRIREMRIRAAGGPIYIFNTERLCPHCHEVLTPKRYGIRSYGTIDLFGSLDAAVAFAKEKLGKVARLKGAIILPRETPNA